MISLGISRPPVEVRTDATDLAIDTLLASITGTSVSTWAAGAVEIAAGLWSRALSTATIPAGAPITSSWLAEVGRDLARLGEVVYLLDVANDGRQRLLRAYVSDISGDTPDPSDWWYRLTICGPRTTKTVVAPSASVVHVRYATERYAPARGIPPLQYASLTGVLTGNLEQALGYETGGAVARLIPLPEGFSGIEELKLDIRGAKGRTLLPESTAGGYGDKHGAPRRDWQPERLGADPPMALVTLRKEVENSVLACFGVPASMGPAGVSDGTAMRESLRRWWTTTMTPVARLISEELGRVFMRPVPLTFGHSASLADIAARARAVHILTQSGLSLEDAMQRAGWE